MSVTLQEFYENHFPVSHTFKWIKAASDQSRKKRTPDHREWSVRFVNDKKISPIRYISFSSEYAFKYFLTSRTPVRIDLGAIYVSSMLEHSEKRRQASLLNRNKKNQTEGSMPPCPDPEYKELTFDVDMDDYDKGEGVRNCCNCICRKCWPLLSIAALLLQHVLVDKWGFKHLLVVFSGRRGIHIWVKDRIPALFLKPIRTRLCKDYVEEYYKTIHDQNRPLLESLWLSSIKPFLCTLQDYGQSAKPSQKKLFDRVGHVQDVKDLDDQAWSLLLSFIKPRIDEGVTLTMGHTLKVPFSPHPDTGKISIPLDWKTLDKVDPDKDIPTLQTLLQDDVLTTYREAMKRFRAWVDSDIPLSVPLPVARLEDKLALPVIEPPVHDGELLGRVLGHDLVQEAATHLDAGVGGG